MRATKVSTDGCHENSSDSIASTSTALQQRQANLYNVYSNKIQLGLVPYLMMNLHEGLQALSCQSYVLEVVDLTQSTGGGHFHYLYSFFFFNVLILSGIGHLNTLPLIWGVLYYLSFATYHPSYRGKLGFYGCMLFLSPAIYQMWAIGS